MTNKTKNILLIVGFLVTLVVCYNLAISKTLSLKKEYTTLEKEALLFGNTPKQLSVLRQKQTYYDSLLNIYQVKGSSIQNTLLQTINTLADTSKIQVVAFLEPHTFKNGELTIKTYQFTLQGNYNALLELVYHLEQRTKFGEIVNLHFERKMNFRSGKVYLQVGVFLRSFG